MSACDHPLDGHTVHGPWCEPAAPVPPPAHPEGGHQVPQPAGTPALRRRGVTPPQAITAGATALHRYSCRTCTPAGTCAGEPTHFDIRAATVVLEAAEPHLAAAEREACAQLAETLAEPIARAIGQGMVIRRPPQGIAEDVINVVIAALLREARP